MLPSIYEAVSGGAMRGTVLSIALGWLVACLPAIAAAAEGDEEKPDLEKIPVGKTVAFAAELGLTTDVLGMGFDRNLAMTDANGEAHRVYPNTVKEANVKKYDAKLVMIENSFEAEAHGRYLFVEAGVKSNKNKRYMILRVYHVSKVVSLLPEGKPQATGVYMYASKIYYGWALYVVIEGDASTFTSDVAANLLVAGGALSAEIKRSHLTQHVHAIGLQPKTKGEVVIATTAEEVVDQFEIPDEAVPIFVEYTVQREIEVEAVKWATSTLGAGQYKIDLEVELQPNKDDGRAWDGGGNPPDPVVSLYIDGKLHASCKQQDSYKNSCLNGTVVDVDENTVLQLVVIDKDVASDDPVGGTQAMKPVGVASLHKAAYFKTKGQVKTARVTFMPVE